MKRIFWLLAALVFAWLPVAAQDPSLPIRRLQDGKPDISGVYAGPAFANSSTRGVPPPINEPVNASSNDPKLYEHLFRPGAQQLFRQPLTGDLRHDDPTAVCLPLGFPHITMAAFYAQQIVQPPGQVVIFYEYFRFYRIIPIGAPNRPHSDWDGETTFMGDAIGWWEGDTLVVDTIGLKEWYAGREAGRTDIVLVHSDALHIIERFTPVDAYRINYEILYDDPKIFTQSWTRQRKMTRQPTWKLLEYVCQENNRCVGGNCTKADIQN